MQFMLLIYSEPDSHPSGEQERHGLYAEYAALNEDLRNRGKHVGADQLQPVSTARTVRVRDGKALVTDGPFAETKEELGGYYLIEAGNLEEALEIAARVPSARYGSIEVRPVVEH
jgi:hypothetical protein